MSTSPEKCNPLTRAAFRDSYNVPSCPHTEAFWNAEEDCTACGKECEEPKEDGGNSEEVDACVGVVVRCTGCGAYGGAGLLNLPHKRCEAGAGGKWVEAGPANPLVEAFMAASQRALQAGAVPRVEVAPTEEPKRGPVEMLLRAAARLRRAARAHAALAGEYHAVAEEVEQAFSPNPALAARWVVSMLVVRKAIAEQAGANAEMHAARVEEWALHMGQPMECRFCGEVLLSAEERAQASHAYCRRVPAFQGLPVEGGAP